MAGVLAAPDRTHLIALEWYADLADVLGREAGEGHRQVEAQGHVSSAVILKAIDNLAHLRLILDLAQQNLREFQRGRIDGHEAVRAVNLAGSFEQLFARDHQLRRIIPESLQRPRLDQISH